MTFTGDWATGLRTAEELREADRHAIEDLGILGVDLMDRAAGALVEGVQRVAPHGEVVLICGKGNNGGDGLAAARLLSDAGRPVSVFATCEASEWSGDAAVMLERFAGEVLPLPAQLPDTSACVVDCVLGTGARGRPEGAAAVAIDLIRAAGDRGAKVVACDVPSGVDASTGEADGRSVKADLTVTFHSMKPGQWIRPGKDSCGEVVVADIGIPDDAPPPGIGLIDPDVVRGLPERGAGADKFAAGAVVVAGGSPGLTGAPLLAGLGAARGGAGYVTVALPEVLLSATDQVPELMGVGLPHEASFHCTGGVDRIVGMSARGAAIVLGPGLGRSPSALAFALDVAAGAEGPLVVDADAIRAFASRPAALSSRTGPTVLTPHSGEMAALLGIGRTEVEAARLVHVRAAAEACSATVVLKGDDTLVCTPDGAVAVSRGGAPALATAGSGDVLGGLVAALLAKGVEPGRAAAAAVAIHAEAGRNAAARGVEGVIASDIAGCLPAGRASLLARSGL